MTTSRFRLPAILAACLVIVPPCGAQTATWIGGAAGQWSDAANWDAAVPAATGRTVFTNDATVTPPAAFTGVLAVTNASTVTINIPAGGDVRFSTALDEGAALVKTGAGTATLQAFPGYHPGAITIASGQAIFAGNGAFKAPGLFGKLTVAAGAGAAIAESPVAMPTRLLNARSSSHPTTSRPRCSTITMVTSRSPPARPTANTSSAPSSSSPTPATAAARSTAAATARAS